MESMPSDQTLSGRHPTLQDHGGCRDGGAHGPSRAPNRVGGRTEYRLAILHDVTYFAPLMGEALADWSVDKFPEAVLYPSCGAEMKRRRTRAIGYIRIYNVVCVRWGCRNRIQQVPQCQSVKDGPILYPERIGF
ncbi:hypothetical protein, variant [Exophiala dermatitidis NIH/UT8656]|uniref:Uncharacterized protein n=1 Tax=Exophiala dermatitidis (strain ATCC 34100 / CBS 525.76 / NIH/UT8656) TaxID=858893 RepID=H6CB42_EXODN|nr:hypothetical protein, variant [Exophiala dermatitidis NIH/UT8656]EHY60988.1 hypothetical protein, variant [Exophiala dermatitidis NIH/UT8656]